MIVHSEVASLPSPAKTGSVSRVIALQPLLPMATETKTIGHNIKARRPRGGPAL